MYILFALRNWKGLPLRRGGYQTTHFTVLYKHKVLIFQISLLSMSESTRGEKRPLDREDEAKEEDENSSITQSKPVPADTAQSKRWGPFPSMFKRWYSSPEKNKDYWLSLPLEEKRKQYKCGSKFLTLDKIATWPEFYEKNKCKPAVGLPKYPVNSTLNEKVSILEGDITRLEIDAIVNAANSSLMGGGGVDGAIHSAASYSLKDECSLLGGCDTGDTKLTTGHRLPAKYILHTVGPINGSAEKLRSCYTTCLRLVEEHNIKSVAFCCIATGVYGFPNEEAANIALDTTRQWLERDGNSDKIDRIIFVVFLRNDYKLYTSLMQLYYPLVSSDGESSVTPLPKEEEVKEAEPILPTLKKNITAPAKVCGSSSESSSDKEEKSKGVAEGEKQPLEASEDNGGVKGDQGGGTKEEGGSAEKEGGEVESSEEGIAGKGDGKEEEEKEKDNVKPASVEAMETEKETVRKEGEGESESDKMHLEEPGQGEGKDSREHESTNEVKTEEGKAGNETETD